MRHDARVLKGVASLKARGHDVQIFGLTPDESEDFVLPNGVPVHLEHRDLSDARARIEREGLPKGRESSILTSFRIQGETIFASVQASGFQPDVVHVHDHVAFTAAALYKESFGCAIVWDAHEIYEDLASIEAARAAVNSRIIAQNAHHADGFITLNQSIADFYRENHPMLPEAVLLPNAVERVSPASYDGRLHREAGLAADQKILLFQGGYSPNRGIPALLEASRLLDTQWSLVFMGWGKLDDEIRTYVELEGQRPPGRDAVVMVPRAPHSELLEWTAGAALGAIPYENNGLNHLYCAPNKLWEYPAAGVPVLASDMPEMRAKIEQYDIGLTVDRRLDPAEVAEAVNGTSAADLERMRRNCATFAAAEAWQNYEPHLIDLHRRLAKEVRAGRPVWIERVLGRVARLRRMT